MKTYENIIDGVRYWYFFDRNIRSWTVLIVDKDDYQVGNAMHYANRKNLLKAHKFDFQNKII